MLRVCYTQFLGALFQRRDAHQVNWLSTQAKGLHRLHTQRSFALCLDLELVQAHASKKNERDVMTQVPHAQGAERIENFHGTVVVIVVCFYEGSTRDQQDEFALDEYTLQTGFKQPLDFHLAPVSQLLGRCSLEKFLRALPEKYFAFRTYKICYGEATIDSEQMHFASYPFAESRKLTYINGTLYNGSQVRSIFLNKPRSKLKERMLEALPHQTFIQNRTGGWRPYDEQYQVNMLLAPSSGEQAG